MSVAIVRGDARQIPLPDGCVDLIVTSPPYFGLRSYVDAGQHYEGQIGSEATPAEWLAAMVECTREWVRVLKPEGSIFINLGDKYAGGDGKNNNGTGSSTLGHHKGGGGPHSAKLSAQGPVRATRAPGQPKSLLGLPWRYALAAVDELGLILRRDIIWAKPNGLPESVTDRCRSSHEYVFHLVKQPRYYAAVDEIREAHTGGSHGGGVSRNGRTDGLSRDRGYQSEVLALNPLGKLPGSVWSIPSQPLTVPPHLGVDHFAAFPVELPRRIVLGWSPSGVCVACGQGLRPVVDKPGLLGGDNNTERLVNGRYIASGMNGGQKMWERRMAQPDRIIGYTCGCEIGFDQHRTTRPALVLDPFAGTGTTLLAAAAYGRNAIGLDRSADYCRLATWRVHDPAERAKAMQVPKPPSVMDGQDTLFTL